MNNASKGRCVTITPSDKLAHTINFPHLLRKEKISKRLTVPKKSFLSFGAFMLFSCPLYEDGHSSEICGRGNPLRLWQRDQDALHQADHHRRYLQRVPSLLHRHAKVRGHRRPRGQIPAARRQDAGRRRGVRHEEKEKSLAARFHSARPRVCVSGRISFSTTD